MLGSSRIFKGEVPSLGDEVNADFGEDFLLVEVEFEVIKEFLHIFRVQVILDNLHFGINVSFNVANAVLFKFLSTLKTKFF